ncbi:hypothetical protein M3Y94_00984200 [Aphelenchoides besseyi]|nr:hypothetical protein M3Y94_00984200 [Aphelenchoides besseyi]
MSNNSIRILYLNHFPLVSPYCGHFPPLHASKYCLMPGMMILNVLTRDMNVKILPLTATNLTGDDELLDYSDRLLFDGTIDLIAKPSQKTLARQEKFDFSDRLYYTHTRVVKRLRTNNYDQFWSFFQTYDTYTWLAILAAWIFQWLACVIVRHVEAKMSKAPAPSISEVRYRCLFQTLNQLFSRHGRFFEFNFINRSQFHTLRRPESFRCSFFSLLQCAIVGVFGSFILGNIIHARSVPQDTMRGVIQQLLRKEYQLVTSSEKFIHEMLNSSNSYLYRQLNYALRHNPLYVVKTPEAAIEAVVQGKAMVFQLADDSSVIMTSQYCDLIAIDNDEMPILESFLMFRKNSSWVPMFNKAIRDNHASIKRIFFKYIDYMSAKRNCSKTQYHEPLRKFLSISFLNITLRSDPVHWSNAHLWNHRRVRNSNPVDGSFVV